MKFIKCLGYRSGNPSDGFDFDCDYENSGEFSCDDCICNGGLYSPISGNKIKESTRLAYCKKYGLAECDAVEAMENILEAQNEMLQIFEDNGACSSDIIPQQTNNL